jgi:hypothetical protein
MQTGLTVQSHGLQPINIRSSIPTEHEINVYHTMAEQAINSKMYGNNYRDKSAVMMIMLSARELGIPPMQALNGGINLIKGKIEISARMMSALIRKAGHKIKVQECSEIQCILMGVRGDTGEAQYASFSYAEAQVAGLVKPEGGWVKWPKDMCFARALSRLARQLFSDVIGIGYVEGEISGTSEEKSFDSFEIVEELQKENEQEFTDKFLNYFDKEDKFLALEWLNLIKKHFEWSTITAIKEILKEEKKMFEKFETWKQKHIISQEKNP